MADSRRRALEVRIGAFILAGLGVFLAIVYLLGAQARYFERKYDLIAEFGMKLTADTEYLHNTGAIAKKGAINAADRELPFSGGRAVEGGSPFGWQLDKDGKPGQVFAAFTTVGTTGKVVVLGDAMVTLLLGTPDGVRLTGVPRNPLLTTYWGKDSAIFMEELLTWLINTG